MGVRICTKVKYVPSPQTMADLKEFENVINKETWKIENKGGTIEDIKYAVNGLMPSVLIIYTC